MNTENQNQEQQPRGRGRGRGQGTRRNFGSSQTRQQEERKSQEKTEQIQTVKNQQPKVVDETKKSNLIEKGKAWLNKHFNGMTKSERGNVRVTVNRFVDFELYSLYESKLRNIISNQIVYDNNLINGAQRMLKPLISTMIGIKLLKANTQHGKATMVKFRGLSDIDFKVPGNLAALIDNFGKSDAINDNVIRINYQNQTIKQRFFDAIVDFAANDDEYDRSNFQFTEAGTLDSLKEYVDKYLKGDKQLRLYDASIDSIEMINLMGKNGLKQLNRHEFPFAIDGTEFKIRLPYLSPEKAKDIEEILSWEADVRKTFTLFDGSVEEYKLILSLALVTWLPLRFIQRKAETFATIDGRFDGTAFANATPNEVLQLLDFYAMDLFMTQDQLLDNTINLLGIYKNRYEKVFDMAFNLKEFKPTEYGSSAQIVEGHKLVSRYLDNQDTYGGKINVVSNRTSVNSRLKMKDDEALIGSIFKFNSGVTFDSNYLINYSNTTQQIRLDYVMKDFKI